MEDKEFDKELDRIQNKIYQKTFRQKMKDNGYHNLNVWVHKDDIAEIRELILCKRQERG